MSQSPSLSLDLKPSPRLAGTLAAMHVLAVAGAAAALPGWALAPVIAGIALSCAATLAEALRRTSRSARAIELRADGRGAWCDRTGRRHEAILLAHSFVTPVLVVVTLKSDSGARKWIVLPPDAAEADDLRRLRAWLRWRAHTTRNPVAEA
jgi:membrane-bound toxin of toxin-antitoxin system